MLIVLKLAKNLPEFNITLKSNTVFATACQWPWSRARLIQSTHSLLISLKSIFLLTSLNHTVEFDLFSFILVFLLKKPVIIYVFYHAWHMPRLWRHACSEYHKTYGDADTSRTSVFSNFLQPPAFILLEQDPKFLNLSFCWPCIMQWFLVSNQLDAQILSNVFIYNSLHVSSTSCSSSGETNCNNTASGNCHSMLVAVSCAGLE